MNNGRELQPGDYATTDFNGPGTVTRVKITARSETQRSASGITFRVAPKLKNSSRYAWLDSGWFKPVEKAKEAE